ncbi:MAG: ABC transporter permease [Chamaesiphon sp.]|nr:ABC transporter permease [Chamaesiphon sp.]
MYRYLNLIKIFWKTAIASELEYRLNFVFAALSSLGGLAGSLFSLFLFYRKGYNFQGWRWEEALIVVGIFTFLEGFANTFLASNLSRIVKHIQNGTLDFVLLKPISSQFWLSFHSFSLWGIPDLLFGLGIIFYGGSLLEIGIVAYFLAAIPLIFGMIIMYSLWFMLGATSIWFTKIYNMTEVLKGLLAAGRFPIAAYPATYRFFFTFVVPVAFMTTIPAQILLGRGDPVWLIGGGCLATVLLILSSRVWQFALRFNTSASS